LKTKLFLVIGGTTEDVITFISSINDSKNEYYIINSDSDGLSNNLSSRNNIFLIFGHLEDLISNLEEATFYSVIFLTANFSKTDAFDLNFSKFQFDYRFSVLKSMEILKILIRNKSFISNSSILFILNGNNRGAYVSINNSIEVLVQYAIIEFKDVVSKVDFIYWDYKLSDITEDLYSQLNSKITLFNRSLN
jgi:hypothetical protein